MNHRERILAAIHHQPLDRLPTDIWATPEVWAMLSAHFQVDNRLDLYDKLGIDGIFSIKPPYIGPPWEEGAPSQEGGPYWENEWGMGFRPQRYATGVYDEQVHYPLAQAETIADLEAYPGLRRIGMTTLHCRPWLPSFPTAPSNAVIRRSFTGITNCAGWNCR